jgi:20S proteasome subunit beta 3
MKQQEIEFLSWNRFVAGLLRYGSIYTVVLASYHFISTISIVIVTAQQSPLTMNGGSVLAMGGNNCVVLAVDKRFGSGRSLIHVRNRPIISLPPSSIVAFTGMEGDVQSLHIELYAQIIDKYYRNLGFGQRCTSASNVNTQQTPTTSIVVSVTAVAMLTSHILYRRKRAPYYVEPVIVGLKPDGYEEYYDEIDSNTDKAKQSTTVPYKQMTDLVNVGNEEMIYHNRFTKIVKQRRLRYRPYICCMDMIGAKSESDTFACAGTASKSLYGTAEALWKPNLSSEQLVHVCINAFLSALERDCLSGYGATIYLLTPNGITEYDIIGRSD